MTADARARSGARWSRGPATTAPRLPRPDRLCRARHDGLVFVLAAFGATRIAPARPPPRRARPGPRGVLADWDARRSAAWAEGDVAALRDLYVAGSHDRPCGRTDAGGVRRSRTARRGARHPGAGAGGARRVRRRARPCGSPTGSSGEWPWGRRRAMPLPRDRASTRDAGAASVEGERGWWPTARDQASAADSTSRTSTSSKS